MATYLCRTCGHIFRDGETLRQAENRHVIDGRRYTTYEGVCPRCGSDDYASAGICAECGASVLASELKDGLCRECTSGAGKRLYAYIGSNAFSDPARAWIRHRLEGIL